MLEVAECTAGSSRATCRSTRCPTTRRSATRGGPRRPRRLHVVLEPLRRALPTGSTPRERPGGRSAPPLPRCPTEILDVVATTGSTAAGSTGESEGYPHSANLCAHPVLVELPPPDEHPLRALQRPARRPARRDPPRRRATSASRFAGGGRRRAGRELRGDQARARRWPRPMPEARADFVWTDGLETLLLQGHQRPVAATC